MSKVNKSFFNEREISQRESACHNRNKKSKCEKCCFKSKQILFFYEGEISQRESACQKTCALTPLPPSSFAGRQVSLALLSPSLIHQHHPHHHHQHLLHHSQRQFAIIVIFWQSIFMLCLSIIVITIIMNSSLAERGSSPPTWLLTRGWSPTSSCCRQPRCCFFLFQSVIRSNSDSKDSCNSIIFRPGSLYSWRARPFNTFISSSITRWSLK